MFELRQIVGYEGLYSVTSDGRVWSHYKQIWMKPGKSDGYELVVLVMNKIPKTKRLHRLVADAWIPKPESSSPLDVNHKNGIRDDNRVENLEWVTRAENCRHAIDTGLWVPDRVNVKRMGIETRKLTVEQVESIRIAHSGGALQKHLAVQYGVSKSTLSYIITGQRYVATL